MRVLSIFIICGFMAMPSTTYSAAITQPVNATIAPQGPAYEKLISLNTKEIQKLIGRKLTFKEKVSLFILKHSPRVEAQSKKGTTALAFALTGIALLVLGFFVPYIILGAPIAALVALILGSKAKKQDPSDKKARTAVVLGWILVGASIALLILIVIALTTPLVF